MTKEEILLQALKDNVEALDSEIAKLVKQNYEEFKNTKLDTIRRKINSLRKDYDLERPSEEIEVKAIVKVKDTDLEIEKDEWLKVSHENRQLKEKLTEKEKMYKALANEYDSQLKYTDKLYEEIPKIPVLKALPKIKFDKKKQDEQVVMMLSDLHAGEVIDPFEMEGMGEYNFDIFCKRLFFLCEKTIEVTENQRDISNIDKLWVDVLGDVVHGMLHQAELNEFSMVPLTLNVALVLSQAIAMMVPHFNEIEVTGVVGNHGRFEKKPPSKRIYNNWDYVVYQQLALMLKDYKNIKFNIPQSPSCIVNRMGKSFLLMHGDAIRGGFAGIPVYGMYRAFNNQQDIRRTRGGFDYMEMGHFHQELMLKDGRMLVNGSMVGNSQYNLHKLHAVAEASQKIFGINSKYGVSWERHMKLEHATEHNFVYQFDDNPVYANIINGLK
jgi:hypothetical protein